MRKSALILMLALVGCQAPQTIIVAHDRAQVNAVKYQSNMTTIVLKTVDAYERSEKKRIKDDHYDNLQDFAEKNGGKLSPIFVKVQTELMLSKLRTVDMQVFKVKQAMVKAKVDFDRFIELTQMTSKYLKSAGMDPQHLSTVREIFESAAEDFIEAKRIENEIKLQEALAELRKLEEEAAAHGGSD